MNNTNKMWKSKPNKYSKKATDWASIGFIAAICIIAPFAWFAAAMIGKTMAG